MSAGLIQVSHRKVISQEFTQEFTVWETSPEDGSVSGYGIRLKSDCDGLLPSSIEIAIEDVDGKSFVFVDDYVGSIELPQKVIEFVNGMIFDEAGNWRFTPDQLLVTA